MFYKILVKTPMPSELISTHCELPLCAAAINKVYMHSNQIITDLIHVKKVYDVRIASLSLFYHFVVFFFAERKLIQYYKNFDLQSFFMMVVLLLLLYENVDSLDM